MKAIFLLFIALAAVSRADDVLEYDADTFDDNIGDHEIILVEFYAPWCGHCKKLAPQYEEAATALKVSDPPVPLAKVDCDANKELCSKFGVSGYPTLKIFRDGSMSADYNGPRDAGGIVSYMQKQAGPVSKELTTSQAVEDFLGVEQPAVIGFFPSDNDDKSEFDKVANSLFEKYKFAFTTNADVAKEHGYEENAVVLFRPRRLHTKLEPTSVKYDGVIKKFKVEKFIKENAIQLLEEPVMKVAKAQTEEIYFAVANAQDFSHQLEEYDLKFTDKPVVTITGKNDEKFKMEDEFKPDGVALAEFLTKYFAGELEQYLKSEPVPASNDGPVKVVVAKTFDEIVNDADKDVLIEFYAPWCGHCKTLAPKYEELGEKLTSDENIVIAKMDATANDVPGNYQVSGFPTIYWAPAGNKKNPKKYQGGREVPEFLEFIKKEATNPVQLEKKDKTEL
ncbi:hypothetical protein BSL78_01782 [Apostichopus japonicus]|uniref:protein disulfide-isomerase n=1 Tax=Stichopus japonicus TaxID=307972 RepID=A0A2G8LM02_STIJA|nr:hypothetical protein BSL78_01782 [Apostichopus japonicus]